MSSQLLAVAMPFAPPTTDVADFSQETWWITLIKAVFIVVFLITSVVLALWVERRGLARMQTRPGPNVAGPLGLFQAFADAVKLLFKEDIWTEKSDKVIYFIAPIISAFSAFMIFAVIPFGPNVNIAGYVTPLQLTDMPVAILYILAIASLGLYGIVLGGWSAQSTLPLLGSVRSAAQVISYELAMSMSLVSVFIVAGSMSTSEIVASQDRVWWAFALAPAFVIYIISMIGEVNRLPFDLPEAEGEIVAGHMTEYSSMKFAWYFLGEYINMFNVSAVATTVFLGGWHAPFFLSYVPFIDFNGGWFGMLWFTLKLWALFFFMVWTRGTLLRFRYDQFMSLGWKILIPVSLVWLVVVAVMRAVNNWLSDWNNYLIAGVFGLLLSLLVVSFFIGEKKEKPATADSGEFDAFAGGYPVPPLPGQTLPVSPRAGRIRATTAEQETASVTAGVEKEGDNA
ncbi:NADH-quinone oxidoreductase subunit NuoH [Gleimia sp. 6138-11-ORH1]|uniref:NADH-quinone oxidoreductase subunit NuoH n=1 Tax=Gleimia sp. 6138-11-ORH1 TaxID=2973937 RepID=UPI0021694111|nr:NADH-quinone oxidoreductase subunit NuoH [Gleimia sp. 6138-11-ORH1]MCS4484656.1 NADH-quinone oxidoreductase subunit NuoH [Gleimia sp. 6138-11-ORH1]